MYDSEGYGRNLRKYMGVSLAWWHSFNWATKRILVVFNTDFIAPMFHSMFPEVTFRVDQTSHAAGCTYLSYIRLAYPSFQQQLAAALAMPLLQPNQRTILTNLLHLCEFFIPVVHVLFVGVLGVLG